MVRYTQRPWYTPVGFMSQSLPSYPVMVMLVSCIIAYPLRFKIPDYWERCSQDPGEHIRTKAILYYHELEMMSQRYARFWTRSEYALHTNHEVRMAGEEIKKGALYMDEDYFRAHYLDSMRIKAMQDEVEELKKALANDRKK